MKQVFDNHYAIMFFIMVLSGLLSTMNVWVDKITDIRFNINDIYMVLLMSGWMFVFMGIVYQTMNIFIIGLILVIINILCIRNQFLVNESQYKLGMIPHHSMAVYISKKLLDKPHTISPTFYSFIKNIIKNQEYEIQILKK